MPASWEEVTFLGFHMDERFPGACGHTHGSILGSGVLEGTLEVMFEPGGSTCEL